jgi:hypothetical protein
MKEEAWVKKTLQEIEQIQRAIVGQQARIDDILITVRKESALALKKIDDLLSTQFSGALPSGNQPSTQT